MTDVVISTSTREQIEADCRKAIAVAASLEARGFDTRKGKEVELAKVDGLLDLFNALYAFEAAT